nr:hypothetical protein CFP56_10935 [Quercus suber]
MKPSFFVIGLLSASLALAAPAREAIPTGVYEASLSSRRLPKAFPNWVPREDIDLHPLETAPFDSPGPVLPSSIPDAASGPDRPRGPIHALTPRSMPKLTDTEKLNHLARVVNASLGGPTSQFYCDSPLHKAAASCTNPDTDILPSEVGVRISVFYAAGMMLADFHLAQKVLQRIRKEQTAQMDDAMVKLYGRVLVEAKASMRNLGKAGDEIGDGENADGPAGQAEAMLFGRGIEDGDDGGLKDNSISPASLVGGW